MILRFLTQCAIYKWIHADVYEVLCCDDLTKKKVCKFFACDVTILMRVSWLFTLRSKQTACDVVYDDNDEVCWHDFRNVQLTGMPKFVCFFFFAMRLYVVDLIDIFFFMRDNE